MYRKNKIFYKEFSELFYKIFIVIGVVSVISFTSCQNVPIDPETAKAQTNKDKKDTVAEPIKPEILECKIIQLKQNFKQDTINLTNFLVVEEITFDTTAKYGIAKFSFDGIIIFPESVFKYRVGNSNIRWKEFSFHFINSQIKQLQDTVPNTTLADIDSLYTAPSNGKSGASFAYYMSDITNPNNEDLKVLNAGDIISRSYISSVYLSSNKFEKRNRILNLRINARFYIPSTFEAIPIVMPIILSIKY